MTLLKLDVDGAIPRGLFFRLVHCIRLWQWVVRGMRYDRTQHGWHITIAIHGCVDPGVMVAAQAILGSDLKREAFNLMRAQHRPRGYWSSRWNCLYAQHSRGITLQERAS